jgi:hypothetical protein
VHQQHHLSSEDAAASKIPTDFARHKWVRDLLVVESRVSLSLQRHLPLSEVVEVYKIPSLFALNSALDSLVSELIAFL